MDHNFIYFVVICTLILILYIGGRKGHEFYRQKRAWKMYTDWYDRASKKDQANHSHLSNVIDVYDDQIYHDAVLPEGLIVHVGDLTLCEGVTLTRNPYGDSSLLVFGHFNVQGMIDAGCYKLGTTIDRPDQHQLHIVNKEPADAK